MNKRSFLKATGVTFVASLFAAPFLGRRESEANAQEGGDLAKMYAELSAKLDKEIETRDAEIKAIRRGLEASFVGTVVAIATSKIPYGWHLCDGTPLDKPEYQPLKDLGLTHFPDYRAVFLRGLDEKTQDGVGAARGFDPGRTLDGKVQESANLKHSHGPDDGKTEPAGAHQHGGVTEAKEHSHGNPDSGAVGGVIQCRYGNRNDKNELAPATPWFTYNEQMVGRQLQCCDMYEIKGGGHDHPIPMENNHTHAIAQSGIAESRPRNVAVRYIIKFA